MAGAKNVENAAKLGESAPRYRLIEFPEDGDLNDFYFHIRVTMVIAHVVFYFIIY